MWVLKWLPHNTFNLGPIYSGGGKGGMRPWRHWGGGGISRGENMEFGNLAASGELAFALQTVIFYTSNTPQFKDHTPTVSAPRYHTKQCVHQVAYTGDLTERSPVVNCRRSILASYCFTGNRNSMFCTIHVFPNSAWNLVIWFSGKFKFVATRCQILRLKCTKFNFGWGSTPDPAWGAYSAPHI